MSAPPRAERAHHGRPPIGVPSRRDVCYAAVPVSDELSLRGIIHDLSNALTVILGWAEQGQTGDPARALSIIEERARSAHVLARRAIGARTDRDTASMRALCTKLVSSLHIAASQRDVQIELAFHGEDDEVPSAAELEQVLQNLLLNAFAFSVEGATVRVEVESQAGGWRVRVFDRGPGIPPEQHASLFLPGHSTRPGGAGLGLIHSRRMAEAAGGSLELESSSAQGSVFRLQWGGTPRGERGPLEGAQVVLVEDDDAIVDLVSLGLEARGARVHRASTREQLATTLEPSCRAVILDWSPIAADPSAWHQTITSLAPACTIVVVTGQPERVSLPGVEVIAKPFEVKELLGAL